MSDTQLLILASSLVATLFGLLIAILSWLGNKTYSKLDEISRNLIAMAGELHERINDLDRRVLVIETHCETRRSTDKKG